MPRTVTLHRWIIAGKASRYAMTEAEAMAKDPRAVPMQGTREVRILPDCPITSGTSYPHQVVTPPGDTAPPLPAAK